MSEGSYRFNTSCQVKGETVLSTLQLWSSQQTQGQEAILGMDAGHWDSGLWGLQRLLVLSEACGKLKLPPPPPITTTKIKNSLKEEVQGRGACLRVHF